VTEFDIIMGEFLFDIMHGVGKTTHILDAAFFIFWVSQSGGTKLQARRSRDRFPKRWIFSNLPNPSSRTMALGWTQPLTEMSTRNLKKETWG
jgi:hypothetical protein